VSGSRESWVTTTHEWSRDVDVEHLAMIRPSAALYAPGGVLHLVLEGLAYPVDVSLLGHADAPLLADGYQRSGMSVVAAHSTWLVHTNRGAGVGRAGHSDDRGHPYRQLDDLRLRRLGRRSARLAESGAPAPR
jgi:hypothetical protein